MLLLWRSNLPFSACLHAASGLLSCGSFPVEEGADIAYRNTEVALQCLPYKIRPAVNLLSWWTEYENRVEANVEASVLIVC